MFKPGKQWLTKVLQPNYNKPLKIGTCQNFAYTQRLTRKPISPSFEKNQRKIGLVAKKVRPRL